MNSLNFLSRQFDALAASRTPPSTPTSEFAPSIQRRRSSSSSATSTALPRVQSWSTKSFLFASRPSSSISSRPKRSVSVPADLITLAAIQRPAPVSVPPPSPSPSLSLETAAGPAGREPLHRTFLMRILVLAWNTLRAAWVSLSRGTVAVAATSEPLLVNSADSPPEPIPIPTPITSPSPPSIATDSNASRSSTTPTTRRSPFHMPKTLVLDLDETLIHSTSRPLPSASSGFFGIGGNQSSGRMVEVVLGGHSTLYHVYKRPFTDFFLRTVSGWYTLVIFTASMQEYADPIIDWLDAGRGILAHRLFRDSCTQLPNGSYTKDLSVVDSDLSRVCLIDNSPISYRVNEANGIPIEGWTHDPSDEALLDLLPFLDSLRFTSDVRRVLGLRTAGGLS
ncbi:FCP1-like proteiny domain-containing protein [Mycena chlorophos]|uniref:FCP1-like proteiny domain-containing protein n=1 Tax=Mycena chlorophos TaxID=658473 RepID=A0A8H6RVT5_MYCCL|nr:FCP1-like proteiny domain-containing protein [Mycena chlorophos]